MAKTEAKIKAKTSKDESFHLCSISITLETKEDLDKLIRWCKERGLFYTAHDYDE
jgi:hypothetical protein